MRQEINLVLQKQGVKKEIRKAFVWSVGVFIAVFAISIISIIVSAILSLQLKNRENEINNIVGQIRQEAEKTNKIMALNERLGSINSVFTQRIDIIDEFLWILSQSPANLGFRTAEVSNESISFSIESDDLVSINTLLDRIYNLEKTSAKVKKADVLSFSKAGEDGNIYALQLKFQIL